MAEVTIEQIREGIAANADLKTQILTEFDADLPEYVKGKGFIVRSAEDDEKEFGKRLNPKVAELYTGIEKDVLDSFAAFGLKKADNNEKIYDMIKRVPSLISGKITTLETQLAAALDGKGDDVNKAQIQALNAELDTLKREKNDLVEGFSVKELGFKVNQAIDKAFANLKISVPASVVEADKADYVTGRINLLKQALSNKYKVKEENGNLVFTDSEDNVQMNGTKVATAEDLLTKDFKYDFETVKKAGTGGAGGKDNVAVVVQSKQQLYDQLAKEGLTQGSTEWMTRANELAKLNGIELPK